MRASKQSQQFARQLFRLSLEDGRVSADRVGGVLAYLGKNPPRQPLVVLRAYHRLVGAQLARYEARVAHAGPGGSDILRGIEASFSRKYQRPITAVPHPDPDLIAGLRIRVGDDLYEASIAGQLAAMI
jgi:F-type H+-transporting ATPase subunit delta